MATSSFFGQRVWSSEGALLSEYWVTSDERSGAGDRVTFTAGSIHDAHNHVADRTHINNNQDLITALNGGSLHVRNAPGWKKSLVRPLSRRKDKQRPADAQQKQLPTPVSSDQDSSSSPTSMSIESAQSVHVPHQSAKRVSTNLSMTQSPAQKKPNFFKRLSRRGASVTQTPNEDQLRQTGNGEPASTPQQSRLQPNEGNRRPAHMRSPSSATRPSPANGNHIRQPSGDIVPQIVANGQPVQTGDADEPDASDAVTPLSPSGPRGGVRWAENFGDVPPTRPRRTSSAATHGRRSSIYSRAAEGDFVEGVDTGAGSKARRLSQHVAQDFQVDECRLEEHFSLISRMNQKDIGEGGAAVVKLMKSKTAGNGVKSDKVFAVKEFRPRDPEEESETEYERKIKSEYAISKSLGHPNVVETYRVCHNENRWFHVMEFCELGDLNDIINLQYFSRDDRNCIFKQITRGVAYLHERGIAHRDLKSENLLLNKDGCVKIADFGTAEVFCGQHPGLRNCRRQSIIDPDEPIRQCEPGWVGSKPYMAPEICQRKGDYDPRAVDVWSLGIIYLTLAFGGNPWEFASPECKNFNIYCNTWDQWLEKYTDGEIKKGRELPAFVYTKQFMMLDDVGTKLMVFGMLHPDPKKRWNVHEVLDSKTVTEYPCCQQEGYSDDIKKRQKKALHNHAPPAKKKNHHNILKPKFEAK